MIARSALGPVAALLALACSPAVAPPPPPAPISEPFLTLRTEPGPRTSPPPGATDLVLVVGCTVRADQTTPYGGPPSTTPFLSSLAASGARFLDPVAAAPWTRPAATAILTGRHALSVGMADPGEAHDALRLPEEVTTLAEHLRDRGWRTLGVTANPNLNDTFGLDQGFQAWRQLPRLWKEEGVKLPGERVVRAALDLLDEPGEGRPTFLLVVLVDAHAPHEAGPEELLAQLDDGVPGQVVAYRAALRRFDRAVEQLSAGLEVRGLGPDRALLAVVNDHGEGLAWPEHHGRSHGRLLAPSAVGGVWLVRGPGIPAGRAVGGLASQVDVAPTLAALAGAPGLATEGRDLSSSILGGAPTGQALVFADTWFQEVDRAAAFTPERACQRSFRPGDSEFPEACFDRASDPTHARPLPPDGAMEALLRWRAERVGRPTRPAGADPALEDQLRALGYGD